MTKQDTIDIFDSMLKQIESIFDYDPQEVRREKIIRLVFNAKIATIAMYCNDVNIQEIK